MQDNRRVQHPITGGFITIVADAHNLPAFWAHPTLARTFPGLVLIHDWRGLTAPIRHHVRRLAELGFYVVAPDLFDGQKPATPAEGHALGQRVGEATMPRINATLSALKSHNRCNGQIGIIGWQMGGELALHEATLRTDLRAAVVFCARPDDDLLMIPADETPILAFYGDSDPDIPIETVNKLAQALERSPGKGRVVIYPGATAGFFEESSPGYHEAYAADAWNKMIDFLGTRLDLPRVGKAVPR